MRVFAKQFSIIFFVGFAALLVALGYGSLSGNIFSENTLLVALRYFGLGFMAAGMVLWISLRRDEAGKPGLNPLFTLLLIGGCLFLLLGVLFPESSVSRMSSLLGLGFMLSALLIGVLVMLLLPAYPHPVAVKWPEASDLAPDPHAQEDKGKAVAESEHLS